MQPTDSPPTDLPFPEDSDWPDSLQKVFRTCQASGQVVSVVYASGSIEEGVLDWNWLNSSTNWPGIRMKGNWPILERVVRIQTQDGQVLWDLERDEPILWVHSS